MKIAIISYHRAINYGAVLQVYAHMYSIEKLGCQCDVIDYRCAKLENDYKVTSLKDLIRMMLVGKNIKKVKKRFTSFRNEYLNLTAPCLNHEDLVALNKSYCKFICGSDQVWNYAGSGFDKAYFLDFVKDVNKKYSYAASFGFESIPDEYKEQYRNLLKSFNKISVREKQASKIIKDLLDKEVEVVVDPTMLLTRDEWSQISTDYRGMKEYILVYVFELTPTIISFTERLAKDSGCQIVYISNSISKKIDAFYARDVGPQEFLGLFLNARYIITNSFHGTMFSINFNKDFFVELLKKSAKVNSRLENALDLFGLRSRQIINGKNDNINQPIDYKSINNILETERNRSLEFLRELISK